MEFTRRNQRSVVRNSLPAWAGGLCLATPDQLSGPAGKGCSRPGWWSSPGRELGFDSGGLNGGEYPPFSTQRWEGSISALEPSAGGGVTLWADVLPMLKNKIALRHAGGAAPPAWVAAYSPELTGCG